MKVSIIIPVKEFNFFLKECLQKCLALSYPDYEIIVLPDAELTFKDERVRVIPTGPCLPGEKRNKGSAEAKGEVLAFLDDDAYPTEQWLAHAVKNFQDDEIAAVGGPAVTPTSDNLQRQASGLILESVLVSGNFRYRFVKDKRRFVEDYPSCNFLVRKSVFDQLGGFQKNFWPGEDTVLCLDITTKLKKKIVYDPEVLVFHHRRRVFAEHLGQIKSYGFHRGYFAKRFPQTSRKWQYFMPSLLLLWLIGGPFLAKISLLLLYSYLFSVLAYAVTVFLNAYQERDMKLTWYVFFGILLTHLTYGFHFFLGLLSSKLKEES